MSEIAQTGRVVAHQGKNLAVETSRGDIIFCHTRRQLGEVTVGDRVHWQVTAPDQGCVTAVLPRSSLLIRPGHGGRIRAVCANLEQMLIVVAPEPECDFLLLDQFLAVCEERRISALIVLNKTDLQARKPELAEQLILYRQIGYPLLTSSTMRGEGLTELLQHLKNRSSMLVGQSGVGKSSITRALLPEREIRIGALSQGTAQLGRHTTTTATLYPLPGGGDLIDSPGVAVFGLAQFDAYKLAAGFREFRPFIAACQFRDCQHGHDKGCALREAVELGKLTPTRYQRYLKLLSKLPVKQQY